MVAGGAAAAAIATLINTSAVPIFDSAMLKDARAALLTTGVASFPGFLMRDALAAAAQEAATSSPKAWITDNEHNAWQTGRNSSVGETHLANIFMRTRVASVAYDQIGPTLRALYTSPHLIAFLSALLGRRLHRLADPLGACSINVFREGWSHAYHFDEAEFTVTLSLQQAEGGGEFLLTPPLRSQQSDPAYGAVAAVLRANTDHSFELLPDEQAGELPPEAVPVRAAPFAPGTLQVFAGRYSLHAVTPTSGPRERLVAVLCFASEPNVRNSAAVQEMFWGRSAKDEL
jgi:hypothetical protein